MAMVILYSSTNATIVRALRKDRPKNAITLFEQVSLPPCSDGFNFFGDI